MITKHVIVEHYFTFNYQFDINLRKEYNFAIKSW